VCGEFFAKKAKKHSLNNCRRAKEAYQAYFGMPVGDQDKHWAPHVICDYCRRTLEAWFRGEKRVMPFAIPRVWRVPSNHLSDCYFCMVDPTKRRKGKNAAPIDYPDIPSSCAPVPHNAMDLPVPQPPLIEELCSQGEDSVSESVEEQSQSSSACRKRRVSVERCPYYPNQEDINDLIKDMALTKSNAELLISRLKQWDLLDDSVLITSQRKRHCGFSVFFTLADGLCFCHDIQGLFDAMDIPCNIPDWRLFIDSSCKSLKAVLLHNTNRWPSIPLAHSVQMKEDYQNVKLLLSALKYNQYGWEVIGDFKMVAFLMGMQGGFTKFPCYLCLWDSRNTDLHYKQRNWPLRSDYVVGTHNVKQEALVESKKVLMPPLHIKLGLIKQFVTKLNPEGNAFRHIQELFPKLSEAKLKAGVFVGPQVKQLINSESFPKKLSKVERAAWTSFVAVVHGFLGNQRAENYRKLIENLVKTYQRMGCRMSLKLHVLHAHLDEFKENLGHYSEEHGERFHQDIRSFEERYKGQYNESMMGDYIWNLLRESEMEYNRASRRKTAF
jgi:hypothetical protein